MPNKISRYTNPSYCLSFGQDDVVFLDLEVDIHKTGDDDKSQFELKLNKMQLSPTQMEFACSLIKRLSTEALKAVLDDLEQRVREEVQPSLFSLFYAGEIQDPTDTTKSD